MTVAELRAQNNLKSSSSIRPGQELLLRGTSSALRLASTAVDAEPRASKVATSVSRNSSKHTQCAR
jgi:LysM repeat protein